MHSKTNASFRENLWNTASFGCPAYFQGFERGRKVYELTNHLGNVLTTVSDRRIAIDTNHNNYLDYYTADILSQQDYYPFGMLMQGRSFSSSGYRYGFNGKEQDSEISGTGNQYDYGFRIYNPRIGRFLSVDPLKAKYPGSSPYNLVDNNPILRVDPNGKDWTISTTLNRDGSQTVHIKLTAAVLNSSANKNIVMPDFAAALSKQVKSSYSTTYNKTVVDGFITIGGGLDGIPGRRIPTYKNVKVNVVVDVDIRVISSEKYLEKNEHLIQIKDDKELPGVYGRANDIGGTKVFVNETKVANMVNGNDNNTLVHELGHTLGLRHIDQKYETFFETVLWGSNPQYYDPAKQKANANNAMFSGGSSYMNDKTSTQINGEQIEIGVKKSKEGEINKH